MYVAVKNEKVTQLLNDWYVEIRSRHMASAHRMKEQIDVMIQDLKVEKQYSLQDQNLLLYYSLLDFRYNYLIDHLSVSKNSFDEIEAFGTPTDEFLSYYYHFFKAIHTSVTGNYIEAKNHFDLAEKLLKHVPDEVEKAEFYYKLGAFHYDIQQSLLAIKQVTKSKEMYANYRGYETNIAFCENLLGLACVSLKEWELAEEHFTAAMDQFQRINEKHYILMVRHNLGWLYASQNLSSLAIRYLSEVVKESPKHYKAIYVKAKEHFKLKETETANELIELGLNISHELGQEEYKHRNLILREINNNSPAEQLKNFILAGITYFERENLYSNVQEYYEILALKFYEEDNHVEANKYFYLSCQARKKTFDKEALK
ncbi:tetratricopeptide repeat protein [Microbacteriaceae bacterium 4G12]